VFAIQAQRAGTKISPARKGWVHRQAVERRRCGTTLFVCSLGAQRSRQFRGPFLESAGGECVGGVRDSLTSPHGKSRSSAVCREKEFVIV
jgi:hypothetical protein